jgi:peptidyl-prolyl cis-trans isomerase SurA
MRKFFLGFLTLACFHSYSQTLFTYGNDSVSVKDFLQAYNKNNTSVKTPQAVQQYLDLYIASRLKIKEALMRRYDTLPQLIADIDNLRSQILPTYEKDTEALNKLTDEAMTRSQKDIHIAHIFIGYADIMGKKDTAKAKQRATEAYTLLKSGKAFKEVALQYSDDTASQASGGSLGYITAFTLPYELENLAYTTAPNQVSKIYGSKAGFHIFKNLGERKALGRIKAAQILIAFPPDAGTTQKKELKKLIDSIYNRLLKGDDFGKLAAQLSNDYVSAQADGQIPEFGVGQYAPAFENAILTLKDGGISKPFETDYGYHIVKRIKIIPASTKVDDKAKQAMLERVEQDERANVAKAILIKKVIEGSRYQQLSFGGQPQLWAYSDSVFSNLSPAKPTNITLATALFKIGNDVSTTADWISFAQISRYKADGSGFKPYNQVWDEFVNNAALEYYKNHLEDFNPAFRSQMTEFKDGNLFFEIMQKEVWGPAQSDTLALEAYYQRNKGKYNWGKSADAIIFYTADFPLAQSLSQQLKKDPSAWKNLVMNMSDGVSADSGRFEINQIPGAAKLPLAKGTITTPMVNKSDNTASFAYVTNIYTQPASRTYEEAKGLVVNDYQAELEQKWLAELRKKYPVVINQSVLASLIKNTAQK